MARYEEDDRLYREDYRERDWERRDRDYGSRQRGEYGATSRERGEYGATSRDRADYGATSRDRGEYGATSRDRADYGATRRDRGEYSTTSREGEWDRYRSRQDYGRRMWPSESAAAAEYTSPWNNQAYGGWSYETGYERPGYGGPWSYGRRYGSDYTYGSEGGGGWNAGGLTSGERWSEGRHVGKGPRGWRRPDARIEDEVCERLARHGYLDASDIDVEVKDCEVTLKGHVYSKDEKRLAEDVAEGVLGVEDVHNKLKVEKRAEEHDDWRHDRDEYERERPAVEGHERTVKKILNA